MKLGNKIKKARLKKKMSQSQLAEQLYITKQSISKYENNKAIPSDNILEKLEDILEIELRGNNQADEFQKLRLRILIISNIFTGIVAIICIGILITSHFSNNPNQDNILMYNQTQITYLDYEVFTNNVIGIKLNFHNNSDQFFYIKSSLLTIPNTDVYVYKDLDNAIRGCTSFFSLGVAPGDDYEIWVYFYEYDENKVYNFYDATLSIEYATQQIAKIKTSSS